MIGKLLGGLFGFGNNHTITAALPLYIYFLGGSAAEVGMTAAAMAVCASLSRPLVGVVLDRLGSRRPILLGCLTMAVVSLLFGLWQWIPGIMIMRGIQGLGFAFVTSGFIAVMGEAADVKVQRQGLAMAGMAMPLSLGFFPWLVERFAAADAFGLVFFIGALTASVSGMFFAASVTGLPRRHRTAPLEVFPKRSLRLGIPLAIAAFLGMADSAALSFLPIYASEQGLSFSLFFAVWAGTMVFYQFALSRGFIHVFRAAWLPVIGCGFLVASLCLLFLFPSSMGLVAAAMAFSLGFGSIETGTYSLVMSRIEASQRGTGVSWVQLAISSGRAVGGLGFGFTAALIGVRTTYLGLAMLGVIPLLLALAALVKMDSSSP